MSNIGTGIIEGFFGPEWSWEVRGHALNQINQSGGGFYFYAPKRDSFLRKNWHEQHPADQWDRLVQFSKQCQNQKIKFGIGLSPFEIHNEWNENTKQLLTKKIEKISELQIDYLGIFFDDMKGSADLAKKQSEILDFIQSCIKTKIIFCPTYYTWDPILDKVFGQRPEQYLESLAENVSSDIEFLWTGNKVISQEISVADLKHVAAIIRRKPIIWENYFANDGPKQCKFLPVKPYLGREKNVLSESGGWAFNLMNQGMLSLINYASAVSVLNHETEPLEALRNTLESHFSSEVSRFIIDNSDLFLKKGLDVLTTEEKHRMKMIFSNKSNFEKDYIDWLDGKYIVGPECLTD